MRELYDGMEFEYSGLLFEAFWMDHVAGQPCEYAVMCMDVPGYEDGLCIGYVPCTSRKEDVEQFIENNFWRVESALKGSDSRVRYEVDRIYAAPISRADTLYHVVGIEVHPTLSKMSDYEIFKLDADRPFQRTIYATYENLDDAVRFAKQAGTPTRRIIGVQVNHRNSTGGFGPGQYVWLNHKESQDRKPLISLKGRFKRKGKKKSC